jgi:hypothetical protein
MGIEFVEVSSSGRAAIDAYLDSPATQDLLGPLTASPDHRALLKLYRERVGQSFKLDALSGLLGLPHEKLIPILSDFALYELAGFAGDDVQFKPCVDEALQKAIAAWQG